jgi:hypothetical protein
MRRQPSVKVLRVLAGRIIRTLAKPQQLRSLPAQGRSQNKPGNAASARGSQRAEPLRVRVLAGIAMNS